MATLQFKPADPAVRISLSLRESSRREQEYAMLYVKSKFGVDVGLSEIIEQAFSIYFAQDKELQKFVADMPRHTVDEVTKRLKKESSKYEPQPV